jgi:hypothetical protein
VIHFLSFRSPTGILEEGRLLNKNLDAEKMANELRICVLQNKDQRTHYLVSLDNEYTDTPWLGDFRGTYF